MEGDADSSLAETSVAARVDPELRLDIDKGTELAGSRVEYLDILTRADGRILTRLDGIQSGFTMRNFLVIKMHVGRLKAEVHGVQCPQLQQELGVFLRHIEHEEITSPVKLVELFQPVAQSLIEIRGAIISQTTNSPEKQEAAALHVQLIFDKLANDAQVYERWGFRFTKQGKPEDPNHPENTKSASPDQDKSLHLKKWRTMCIVGALVVGIMSCWMWRRFEYQQNDPSGR